jgi:hypothetical protein
MPMIEIWDPSVQLVDLFDLVQASEDLDWNILEILWVGRDDEIDLVTLDVKQRNLSTG